MKKATTSSGTVTFKNAAFFSLLTFLFFFAAPVKAQLTGIKTIPGDYPTIAAAVSALNSQGVGPGGVTFDIAAGYTETAPAGGITVTASGTATDQVLFEKSGIGANPVVTAFAPQASGSIVDAVIKLVGADYITFDRIDVSENAANTTTTSASNNMTEFGYALFYASTTNGSQNNVIKNCNITLNRTYTNTIGIYSTSRHSATSATTAADVTNSTTGPNHNNHYYTNNISNVNLGIVIIGSNTAANMETGLEIGGSATTGNIISNFGTAATASGYISISGTINGIDVSNATGFNISYNTITSSNGGVTTGTLRGIFIDNSGSTTPAGTFTNNITNNTVTLAHGGTTAAIIAIHNTLGNSSSTVNINNNTIQNSTYATATTGAFTGIQNASSLSIVNITGNTINNNVIPGTGTMTLIEGGSPTTLNITNNTITNNSKANNTGSNNFFCLKITSPSTANITGNLIDGNTLSGTAGSGGMFGIYGLSSSVDVNINNNVVRNLSNNETGSGTVVGIREWGSSGIKTVQNNQVYNLTANAGVSITGIQLSTGTITITANQVYSLTGTGGTAGTHNGIAITNSSPSTVNITRNKIYDISGGSAGATVNGINLSVGTTVNVVNNLIGNLYTPAATGTSTVNGINISGPTTVNVYYNTVYLNATSSGANFGSSAINAATGNTVDIRNNIFVNTSTATGTGLTVATRRSSTTLTSLASTSNNNLYYAGTPSAANLIYYDGTNSDQTFAAYKTRVNPRESSSITENPPFLSTTGSSANFLHIDPLVATKIESGAAPVSGFTNDYDALNIRTGYPLAGQLNGGGVAPDMGADEYDGTPIPGIDIATLALVSPAAPPACGGVSSQTVIIQIKNISVGAHDFAVNPVTVNSSVTGPNPVTFTPVVINSGTLAANTTMNVTVSTNYNMSAPGTYTFNASSSVTGDLNTANDQMTAVSMSITPLITVTPSTPYFENFETGQGFWTSGGTSSSWAFGTAAKTIIQNAQNSTLVGTNVWTTGGLTTGTYNNSERSYVLSPCFDLTGMPASTSAVRMAIWWNSERNFDGAALEYSTDGGATWTTIGAFNDPYNWYNSGTMSNSSVSTFFNNNTNWWSGRNSSSNGSGMWLTAKHVLPSAALVNGVRFRIAFASDGSGLDDGFAFDNFTIYELPALDMGAAALVTPVTPGCYGGSENVSVSVTNFGTAPIDFSVNPVTVTVNVTGAATQTLSTTLTTGTLAANASQTVTAGTLNMNTGGNYIFNATTAVTGDGDAYNNAMAPVTRTSVAPVALPQAVSFTGFTGSNLTTVFPNWTEAAGTTPAGTTSSWTSQTGVGGASNVTARVNLYTTSKNEWIVGPKFIATANSWLRFKAAVTDFASTTSSDAMGSDDKVRVMISTDCGITWVPVYTIDASTPLTTSLSQFDINLSAYNGQNIVAAFYATDGPVDDSNDYDFHIDDINIVNAIGLDIGATALAAPAAPACYGNNETVTVTIKNYGVSTADFSVNNANVNVNVTGPNPQTLTTTITSGTLTVGATMNVQVATGYNMSAAGTYTFNANTSVPAGDYDPANDAMTAVTRTTVAPIALPQTVSFTGYTGANLVTVFPNWTEAAGTAPAGTTSAWTSQTGVSGAGNITARVNLFSNAKNEWIVGPKITAASNTTLRFKAAVTDFGTTGNPDVMGSDDKVRVMVSNTCGATWTPVLTMDASNNLTTTLTQYGVNLGAYAGQDIMVAFYATDGPVDDPENYDFQLDDINLDNVTGIDMGVTSLVAPVTGSGCFTANQAVTVNIRNHGFVPVNFATDNVTVSVNVTGPNPQVFTTTLNSGTLAAGATMPVTVTNSYDMTTAGNYVFNASTSVATADYDAANNAMAQKIISSTNPSAAASADVAICAGSSTNLTSTGTAFGPTAGSIAFTNTTAMNIIDLDTIRSYITVTSPLSATDLFSVTIDSLTHTFDSDLDIFLVAPNGSRIELTSDNGSTGDNYIGTRFIPTASTSVINGLAPFTGDYLPEQSFSGFSGAANGVWGLYVYDDANNDTGTLKGWHLNMKMPNSIASYSWSPATGLSSSTAQNPVATPASTTTYTVTITDANGCAKTDDVTVTVNPNPVLTTSTTNVSCNGGANGTATVNATSGNGTYNYTWTTSPAQTGTTATGLAAGAYTVTVTDGNTCSATASVTITEPTLLTTTVMITNVSCNGGNDGDAMAMPSGGTGTYTYLWSNGQTTQTATGLTANSYTVTVTDQNLCSVTASVTITEPTALTASIMSTNVSCNSANDGDAMVMAAGGPSGTYTYLWSNGQTTQTATGLAAGNYTVTVTDGACQATATVSITEPTAIITSMMSTNVSCNGGNNGDAMVMVMGGPSGTYTYLWNDGQTTQTATALAAGSYTVTITDGACQATATVTITEPAAVTVSIMSNNVSCNGADDGDAMAMVSGGPSGSYTYMWSDGQTTQTATGLAPGTYTVTVNDGTCQGTATVTITEPFPLALNLTSNNESCSPGQDGVATAYPTGGSGNYSYSWNTTPVQTTAAATGLTAGTYSVTVTDAVCGTVSGAITVNASSAPAITISNDTTICAGSTINLVATGGTSYVWDNGAGNNDTATVSPASTTVYSVTVSTGICVGTASVTVTVDPQPSASYTYTFGSPGTVVNFTNGSSNATAYSWDFGDGSPADNSMSPTYDYLFDGTYTATLVASNSCGSDTTIQTIVIITTGIGSNGEPVKVMVAPNPSAGVFTLTAANANFSTLQVDVMNVEGQVVYSTTEENINSSFSKQIDISSLAKGVYNLRLNTGSQVITKRIVIQ